MHAHTHRVSPVDDGCASYLLHVGHHGPVDVGMKWVGLVALGALLWGSAAPGVGVAQLPEDLAQTPIPEPPPPSLVEIPFDPPPREADTTRLAVGATGRPSSSHHEGQRWHVGCAFGTAFAAVPLIRPFVACGADRRFSGFALARLSIRHDFRAKAEGPTSGEVRASRTRVEAALCASHRGFLACGTASAGVLQTAESDVSYARRELLFVPTAGAALGYAFDARRTVRMTALFALDIAIERPGLRVRDELAYTLPIASPSLSIQIDWGR